MIQSLEERMKVFVRIKPEKANVILEESTSKSKLNPNQYDYVLQSTATQEDVFTNVGKHIIDNAIQGYNGCVIAYGQTCSGKTHTLIGNKDKVDGLLPQCLKYLFTKIDDQNFNIQCSFLQIYAEKLQDLLSKNEKNLKLRAKGFIKNLTTERATNFDGALDILNKGLQNRRVSKTDHNDTSSRSHAIFKINYSKQYQEGGCKITLQSKIYFVDLAGSERLSIMNSQGQEQLEKETKDINKSLFNLGKVIRAIVDQKQHIPFRDSKLTQYLQESLEGNSKTSLIATIKPSDKIQTDNTLLFADNFKVIKIKPLKNTQIYEEQNNQDIRRENLIILLELEQQKNKQLQDIIFQLKQEYGQKCENDNLQIINLQDLIQSLDKQLYELKENQNHKMDLFQQQQKQQQQEQTNHYIKIFMDQKMSIQQDYLRKKQEQDNFKIRIVEDKISKVENQINEIKEKKNYKREFDQQKLKHSQLKIQYEELEKDFEIFKQNQRVQNQNNETSLVQDLIRQSEQNHVTIEEELQTQYEIQIKNKKEIDQQKQNIQNKNQEIEQLKQDIQNKNQQIKQQKKDIQNKDQQIFNQNQTIEELQQQIETLKNEAKLLYKSNQRKLLKVTGLDRIISELNNYIETTFVGKQRIMTEKQIQLNEMAKIQTQQSEIAECLLQIVFLDSINNYIK